jgi:hypothetical protein
MKGTIPLIYFMTVVFSAGAQDTSSITRKDSAKLVDVVRKARIGFRSRTMYMATINRGSLKDDYAIAQGVGLGVSTFRFRGFQATAWGFVVYNISSSPLDQPDSLTQAPNRYEVGMFDVEDPGRKYHLFRIEHLNVNYTATGFSLTAGRLALHTPFMNPQDGRMNVSMEEGAWMVSGRNKWSCSAGWFWRMSPRSTTKWYSVGSSLGIYPSGVSENGLPSMYAGNIATQGVGLINFAYGSKESFRVSVWDMLIENVMNTAMIELNSSVGKTLKFYQGVMFIHQDAVNQGGNPDQSMTYLRRNSRSNSISAQAGIRNKRINSNVNYTHITGDGRYLSPREWGRDPFYTFMFREKNDGFGNVHAFTIRSTVSLSGEKMRLGAGFGYFALPDVRNYRLNKYGVASYQHVILDWVYAFGHKLKGMELKFVGAWKINAGETYNNPRFIYNKADMFNLAFQIDYRL